MNRFGMREVRETIILLDPPGRPTAEDGKSPGRGES
jgi:hypothetical protein